MKYLYRFLCWAGCHKYEFVRNVSMKLDDGMKLEGFLKKCKWCGYRSMYWHPLYLTFNVIDGKMEQKLEQKKEG